MHEAGDESLHWLEQAQEVIRDWEAAGGGRMLLVSEAGSLEQLIARALMREFERGRRSSHGGLGQDERRDLA